MVASEFKLALASATRNFFPVEAISKKTGEVIIGKDGEAKQRFIPGSYTIYLNNGDKISVVRRLEPSGRFTEDGKPILERVTKVSVTSLGSFILDDFGRSTGAREKPKQVFRSSRWEKFEREYRHCGMPSIVLDGMMQADEEMMAKRQAA